MTAIAELVLAVLPPSVTSLAVTVWLPVVFNVTLKIFVPPDKAAFAGKIALPSVEATATVQHLHGPASLRPEVARAMDPGLRRRLQLVVDVNPLRIVGREHVRLDAERREVRGELQRALYPASARGRVVHRHEQDLHRPAIVLTPTA